MSALISFVHVLGRQLEINVQYYHKFLYINLAFSLIYTKSINILCYTFIAKIRYIYIYILQIL